MCVKYVESVMNCSMTWSQLKFLPNIYGWGCLMSINDIVRALKGSVRCQNCTERHIQAKYYMDEADMMMIFLFWTPMYDFTQWGIASIYYCPCKACHLSHPKCCLVRNVSVNWTNQYVEIWIKSCLYDTRTEQMPCKPNWLTDVSMWWLLVLIRASTVSV